MFWNSLFTTELYQLMTLETGHSGPSRMAFSGPSAGFTTQEFEGGTSLGDRLCCGECFRMVVSWIDEVFQTQICVVFILHMLQSEHDCASNNTEILYWLIKHLPTCRSLNYQVPKTGKPISPLRVLRLFTGLRRIWICPSAWHLFQPPW